MKRFFLIFLLFICSLGIIYSQVIIDEDIEEKNIINKIDIGRNIDVKSLSDEYSIYDDFKLELNSEEELSVFNNGIKLNNDSIKWSSLNEDAVKIDEFGKIKAIGLGNATIKAELLNGVTDTIEIDVVGVNVSSIKLDKSSLSLALGNTAKLTATVLPDNASVKTVTWKSSNTKVATVDKNGLVKGLTAGNTIISATTNGHSSGGGKLTATCSVKVVIVPVTKVRLSKTNLSVAIGNTSTLKATVYPINATVKTVTWKSSNTKVATIDKNGLIKGIKKGTVTITATTDGKNKSGKKISATCNVKVVEIPVTKVRLSKTSLSLVIGNTYTLTATVYPTNATYKTVTWKSSNTKVATVDKNGLIKAIAKGSVNIIVTSTGKNKSGNQVTSICKVKVVEIPVTKVTLNKSSLSIAKGCTSTLTAKVSPNNATVQTVTWKSSNTKIATVDKKGVVKGVSIGSATITVTTNGKNKSGKQLSTTCKVTVTKPISVTSIKLNKSSVSLEKGDTFTLVATVLPSNASDRTVTWKSSNTKIAIVSTTGIVTGVSKGSATITATTNGRNASGKQLSTTCSVKVTENNVVKITIKKPTKTYNNAYLLKYSNDNHIIQVAVTLPNSLKNEKLTYEWHLDSTSGYKLKNTDSVYDNAEFIYRPKKTSVIPKDVTTGVNRAYNRGFKTNFIYNNKTIIGKNIYLLVKNSKGVALGSYKFYVAKPETPPQPNR